MKMIPSFLEYRTAKSAIDAIARSARRNAADVAARVRGALGDRRHHSDQARPTSRSRRDGNEVVIAFAYRKEVPLFGPVGLYIDFAANSKRAARTSCSGHTFADRAPRSSRR